MCTTIAHHDNTMVSSTKPEEQQYQQQHRLVKVKAEGREQLIELSADRTFNRPNLHDLLESVVSVFGLQQEQQPQQQQQQQQQRRYQVSLSYLHPGGGKAFLSDDCDLLLALAYWRSCPVLTVRATFAKKPVTTSSPEEVGRLYHAAAEQLRTSHGVKSITAASLEQTVSLLNLPPRRLVTQGLAPHWSLNEDQESMSSPRFETTRTVSTSLSTQRNGDGDGDGDGGVFAFAGGEGSPADQDEVVSDADVDLMSEHECCFSDEDSDCEDGEDFDLEDLEAGGEDELNTTAGDVRVSGCDPQEKISIATPTVLGPATSAAQRSLSNTRTVTSSKVEEHISGEAVDVANGTATAANVPAAADTEAAAEDIDNPIHKALLAGGINVHPLETDALIHALGVDPQRLVGLGLVECETAPASTKSTTTTTTAHRRRAKAASPRRRNSKKFVVRVPVRLVGSKSHRDRAARESTGYVSASVDQGARRSGGRDDSAAAIVLWPQLLAYAAAGQATRGKARAGSGTRVQVHGYSRHGAQGRIPCRCVERG